MNSPTRRVSIADMTMEEILTEYPWLAKMTPRQIANHILHSRCRLSITPGHACRQQLPFVTFRSVQSEMGFIFVLDSCLWYGEQWVIKMDLLAAMLISISPVRMIQASCDARDEPICATVLSPELCRCMDIIPATKYLEMLREHLCQEKSRRV